MSHNDDLLLVTACRDMLEKWIFTPRAPLPVITSAALSLIEDTLKRHAPQPTARNVSADSLNSPYSTRCADHDLLPCKDYDGALAALHTIATALGVDK